MSKMLVDGQLKEKPKNKNGQFHRLKGGFYNRIEVGDNVRFPPEASRYHLYISQACPWSHRTTLMRSLKQLRNIISVSEMEALRGENGWSLNQETFDRSSGIANDCYLYEVYLRADPNYTGPVSVPVLWDKKLNTIVSTESEDIMRMLNTAFNAFTTTDYDYYPPHLRAEINSINDWLQKDLNNAVYQAGFASTQNAYEEAALRVFRTLDELEKLLGSQAYLVENRITEADLRLFATLIRFDAVYVTHFKLDHFRISDYPSLKAYVHKLLSVPGISDTIDMNHIRQHYFTSHTHINPTGIIPLGPGNNFSLGNLI